VKPRRHGDDPRHAYRLLLVIGVAIDRVRLLHVWPLRTWWKDPHPWCFDDVEGQAEPARRARRALKGGGARVEAELR